MESNHEIENKKESLPLCPKCAQEVDRNLSECPKCRAMLFFHTYDSQERLEKIARYSLGQMFLKEQEYLFETIYKSERLIPKMLYFLLYSLVFSAIYGAILGAEQGASNIAVMSIKVPLLLFSTLVISTPLFFCSKSFFGNITFFFANDYATVYDDVSVCYCACFAISDPSFVCDLF